MRLTLAALALPFLLFACASNPPPAAEAPTSEAPTSEAPDASAESKTSPLGGYRWVLTSATDASGARIDALFPSAETKRTLSFDDGRLSVTGGCNNMSGSCTLSDGKLTVGPLAATEKACEPALMAADTAAAALFAQPAMVTAGGAGPSPTLRITSASGNVTVWAGEATAETRYGAPEATMFLEIAPARVACSPDAKEKTCLSAREVQYDGNSVRQPTTAAWQPLQEEIEGFTFVDGERTIVRVKKFKRANPPAGGSATVYVLDATIESEVTTPAKK